MHIRRKGLINRGGRVKQTVPPPGRMPVVPGTHAPYTQHHAHARCPYISTYAHTSAHTHTMPSQKHTARISLRPPNKILTTHTRARARTPNTMATWQVGCAAWAAKLVTLPPHPALRSPRARPPAPVCCTGPAPSSVLPPPPSIVAAVGFLPNGNDVDI